MIALVFIVVPVLFLILRRMYTKTGSVMLIGIGIIMGMLMGSCIVNLIAGTIITVLCVSAIIIADDLGVLS